MKRLMISVFGGGTMFFNQWHTVEVFRKPVWKQSLVDFIITLFGRNRKSMILVCFTFSVHSVKEQRMSTAFLRTVAQLLWTSAEADSMESLKPEWKSIIFKDKAELWSSCLALRLRLFSIAVNKPLRRQDAAAVRSPCTEKSLSSGC